MILTTKGLAELEEKDILNEFKFSFIDLYNNLNLDQKSSDEIVKEIVNEIVN